MFEEIQWDFGPVRHGLFVASCSALALLDQVAESNPSLSLLVQLTNSPKRTDVCKTGP